VKTTYGLGLTGGFSGPLDISTKTGADMARSQLLSALSAVQSTYQTSNAPAPTDAAHKGNTGGSANSATVSQLNNYNLALSLMNSDPSNAVSNIQQIVSSGGSSGNNSLLSALSGL